ncbi:HBR400Cp [Eremothecium sinecaudum]|uniref:HBR400Cp n=1 Tax=Eremothecium sinecaudum TaxID=45286 RepID=A0A109UXE5_9SACH|nr:HBR400Cp [Eremothecium sinecaudum]AMD19301.1 HBR400Cp [Eremothecium sinecaudum]
MTENSNNEDKQFINYGLPPDIVLTTLPYLDAADIKNLSLTNKYFNRLLDYQGSNTLWRELYRKAFGYNHTNDEPFISNSGEDYKTCSEMILVNNYPEATWLSRYKYRQHNVSFHTWGCLQHARLGYTTTSHPEVTSLISGPEQRRRTGINKPTPVPWFKDAANEKSEASGRKHQRQPDADDKSIVQISAGGFSFQLLTKSGKLFSTGTTYNGSHRGPGPKNNERDFNVLQEMVTSLEESYPRRMHESIVTSGMFGIGPGTIRIIPNPHQDMYRSISDLLSKCEEYVTDNQYVRRLFARDSFNFYMDESDFTIDRKSFDKIKFVAVSSGRAHILALDDKNEVYSWDSPGVDHGVRLLFEGLPTRAGNPVLKIGCGWDFNCVYIYAVGLVVWDSRYPLKKGDMASKADYKVIPETGDINGPNRILDFACCSAKTVFYITNEGDKLWMYSHERTTHVDLPINGRFRKIEASRMSLAIFTEQSTYTLKISDGEVVDGSLVNIDIAPDKKFITLSSGDYHNIALTEDGELYSWGLESELCGCLGIGDAREAVEVRNVATYQSSTSICVAQPTKVQLPSNSVCVAIAAGGWQSGALILQK